jgi:hypothetical protein
MPTFVDLVIARLNAELAAEQRDIRLRQHELRNELAENSRQYTLTELRAKRLAGPRPADDLCPRCWYMRGATVKMETDVHDHLDKLHLPICPICLLERDGPPE